MAYFKLKSFSIYDKTNQIYIEIDENEYNNQKSIIYELNDYRDTHYDPPVFYNYIADLSNKKKNKDIIYIINYKYEYFNHHNINEYQNAMMVFNGEITDKLFDKFNN
jgi:hypothetical protein